MKSNDSNRRPGIKEIAEALGISIGTVDRALHGRRGVKEKTQQQVLKMARQLQYTPNLAARNLKLNRRLRVGVFLPEQIASFFDPLRAGIRSASQQATGATIETVFHTYPRIGVDDIETMERSDWRSYDGVILIPGNPARLSEIAQQAQEHNHPLIYVVTDAPRVWRLASIAVESFVSGGLAAELLGQIVPERGSVAAITGERKILDHAEKLKGFAATLATMCPHLQLLPAIESHESPEDAYEAVRSLLQRYPDLSGIYISTANSLPVMRALEECGRLGKVKVIATDLFPELAHYIESGHIFASLHQRPFTQGKLALEFLTQYLVAGTAPPCVHRLAPHIVLRSNLPLFLDSLSPEEPADKAESSPKTRLP